MQITTFNPMILSKNADDIIKLFEELGFERKHQKDGIDGKDISSVRMTDANGFHVDVARVENMERDMTTIRMNVRDFNEAYEFLKSRGFKNATGTDHTANSESSISCLMISPSGFSIQLTQHIRKEDR
ncbi:MAG: VOC family protein [Lachnospiraceae bacterium]|nr:VOC family protein [Lachnospiraceae bacterium]